MELFVFRHAEWERRYNCALVEIDSIPLERRIFVPESIVGITLCTVYYVLYIPCVISIWRRTPNSSCYRLLFYISVLDMCTLWGLGFYVGWMSLTGRVFCSAPTLNYWVGMFVTALSITECYCDMILALNRTLDMLLPWVEDLLFGGRAVYVWLTLNSAVGIHWIVFVNPNLYSSVNFGGWFFNPYAGYNVPTEQTEPFLHIILSYGLFFVIPSIYAVFLIGFLVQLKWNRQSSIGMQTQFMIFLQVFLISLFNATGGFFYMYCQDKPVVTQTEMTVALFGWFHTHGSPPVIYLTLNKTIRQDCREMVVKLFKRFRAQNGNTAVVVVVQGSSGRVRVNNWTSNQNHTNH